MSPVQHSAIHNYPRTVYQIGRKLLSEAVAVGGKVLFLTKMLGCFVPGRGSTSPSKKLAGEFRHAPRSSDIRTSTCGTHHKQCALPR